MDERDPMTCRSCRWSTHEHGCLWCILLRHPAMERCRGFEYEPGTDESEIADMGNPMSRR